MPKLAVGDRVVSYEDYGAGPLVVLVHGSPGNSRSWQRVGERLAARHRVVAPDLPGHGGATTPQPAEAAPDVAYTATLIEALVDAVGRPALLVGYSYGGVVALAVALHGAASGALALLEPVAVPVLALAGDDALHARTRAVFNGYIADVEAGDPTRVETMVDFWFGPGAFAGMPAPLREYMIREAPTNVRDVRGTLRAAYSAAALARLAMPVTTVVGGRSPEATWTIARTITARVARGSLLRLDDADHAMITTHSEALAQTLAGLTCPRP